MNGSPARGLLAALLLFSLLALAPLWRPVLLGDAFLPAGMQRGMAPWIAEGEPPGVAWDVLRWDSIAQFYPWRKYLFESLAAGDVPLWNRHVLLGTPFLANSQSAVMYPPHWPLAPLGPVRGMSTSALLHLAWAALGAYVLCRRLGAGFWPAVTAGVTLEWSQWMIAWQQLPSVPMTTAWIPWGLAVVHRVWSKPDFGSVTRLGACGGMMLLAGHPQIATYGVLAALLLVLWLAVAERRSGVVKPVAAAAAGLALAGAVASAQLLPVYEMGKLSHRAGVPTAEGYDFYVRLAMPPAQLGLAADPYFSGDPAFGSFWSSVRVEQGYWGSEPLPEYACYLGLVALVLAAYVLVRWRECRAAWFYIALGAFAWLLALGTPLNKLPYFGVPGWSSTGSPARVLCLAAVAGAVLAGLGLQRMVEDREAASRLRWALSAGALVAVFACAVAVVSLTLVPEEAPTPSFHWLIVLAAMSVLALGFGLNFASETLRCVPRLPAVAALQALTLLPFVLRFNTSAPADEVYPPFEGLALLRDAVPYRVAAVNEAWSSRDYPARAVLPPNSALAYGYDSVEGYDSLILRVTKERVLDALNGGDSAPVENGNMLFVKPPALAGGVLPVLGVRYVVTPGELTDPGPLRLVSRLDDRMAVYEFPDPAPLAVLRTARGEWACTLRWTGPDAFEVDLPPEGGRGLLGIRVIAAPGWRMGQGDLPIEMVREADGEPAVWLTARADAAQGHVHARYEPRTYRVGLFLSLLGLAICVAGAIRK